MYSQAIRANNTTLFVTFSFERANYVCPPLAPRNSCRYCTYEIDGILILLREPFDLLLEHLAAGFYFNPVNAK